LEVQILSPRPSTGGRNQRGCGHPETRNWPGAGRPFFAIIATGSLPWIFSPSQRSVQLLYGFFNIIRHDRRQIVHCNVTRHPTGSLIVQQLRDAFRYESASKFLLFDHDQKYGPEVLAPVRSLQIACVRTSIRSPWQNGVAERWVGSCRRDLLDHIIAVNERHLKRLLADYIRYYHDDRTHLGLRKQNPEWQTAFRRTRVRLFRIRDSVAFTIATNVLRNSIMQHSGLLASNHSGYACTTQ